MPKIPRTAVLAALAAMAAEPVWAYIGPGAGLSLLGAFWTLLMAVFAAAGFLVLWPVRRLLRHVRLARGERGQGANFPAPETRHCIDPDLN